MSIEDNWVHSFRECVIFRKTRIPLKNFIRHLMRGASDEKLNSLNIKCHFQSGNSVIMPALLFPPPQKKTATATTTTTTKKWLTIFN